MHANWKKNVCHGWTLHIISLAKKVREEMFIFHYMCIQILPSNNSCFVYTQVFQVRARGMYGKVLNLCRQCLLSGQSIGLLSTWKLTTHSSESTLARSKGRDLSRTLIKCYYLTYMYIYKFIYYISYDGRHFSSNKKKYSIHFFVGRWRGNCV